jgi:hypothetical protein
MMVIDEFVMEMTESNAGEGSQEVQCEVNKIGKLMLESLCVKNFDGFDYGSEGARIQGTFPELHQS